VAGRIGDDADRDRDHHSGTDHRRQGPHLAPERSSSAIDASTTQAPGTAIRA